MAMSMTSSSVDHPSSPKKNGVGWGGEGERKGWKVGGYTVFNVTMIINDIKCMSQSQQLDSQAKI